MADIEASVAITAQTDGLGSGLQQAADAVSTATAVINARLTTLGTAAQQAQEQIKAAAAQIGSSLGALQTRADNLAHSVSADIGGIGGALSSGNQFPGMSFVLDRESEPEDASIAPQQQLAAEAYQRKQAAISEQAALDATAHKDEVARLQDALDTEWDLHQDFYAKKAAATAADALMQQNLTEEQQLAYQDYVTERERLDTEAVQNSAKQGQSLLRPLQRSLDSSITGLITGTTTVQKALSNLVQSGVGDLVNAAVGRGLSGIGALVGSGLFGAGGDQDFSGGAIGTAAELGAGGIFTSFFRGIGALFGFQRGGIVPSAQSGWAVPQFGPGGVLARLHSNEMVLPAPISQGLQAMIAGGGAPATNVTFAVSAMDAQSVAAFFKNNGAALVAAINRAVRNGSPLAGMAT